MYERAGDKESNRECTCDVTEEEERETTEKELSASRQHAVLQLPYGERQEFALLASPEATSERHLGDLGNGGDLR